jgi:asparagine synthase (glutamine-hydrolysing)
VTGDERVSAGTRLTQGAWVARFSRKNGPPTLDTSFAEGAAAQLATDRRVQGVLAGLLHNRRELTEVLGLDRDTGEAATVVAAYRRWGDALLGRLEGVFAAVIWDEETETLLAARDPLGSYPLFYAEGGEDLYVSNSIDTLLVQPGVSNAVNIPGLADHLHHRWPRAGETYFEVVHRVPPGHVLLENRSGRKIWRYWDPAPEGTIDWIEGEEVERFDWLLEQSVARCLAAGHAGIFLSGGLDSVSIAAVAASSCRRHDHPDPLALSLAFPDPDANEEPRQRAVAAALELQQVMLAWTDAVPSEGLVRAALDLTAASPAPLINLWLPAYDRLGREGRARGCSVILTGNGGDEWLTVSPYYAADLMRVLDVRGLYSLFHDNRRSHRISSLLYLRNFLWRFGARPLLVDGAKKALAHSPSLLNEMRVRRRRSTMPGWLAPDPRLRSVLLERSLEADASAALDGRRTDRRHPRLYIREMRSGLDHPLVAMELEELFEQGRRLGLQVLQPYWDAALVEFLYRMPPKLLNRGGRSKGLVRETVARRFPRLGFEIQRKVTASRFGRSLIVEEGRRALNDLGGATALADAGVVHAPTLNEDLNRILRDPHSRESYIVWNVLTLERWLRARRENGRSHVGNAAGLGTNDADVPRRRP